MPLLLRRRALMAAAGRPNDGRYCYAINSSNQLLSSEDYGVTWTNRGSVGASPVLGIDSEGNGYAIGGGNLYVLQKGASSPSQYTGQQADAKSLCVSSPGTGLYATNDGSSWQTGYQAYLRKFTGNGAAVQKGYFSTWDQAAESASACSKDGKYAVFGGRINYTNGFVSRDGGESWTEILATSSYWNGTDDVAVSANGEVSVVCGSGNSNLYYSTDYTQTFVASTALSHGGSVVSCDVTEDGKVAFLASRTDGVRKCTSPFTSNDVQIASEIMGRIRCNALGTKLIAIGSDRYIYYSHNGGYNWTRTTVSGVIDIEMYKQVL